MNEPDFYPAPPGGVPYMLRQGADTYPFEILMLHGWGGDERVMWVLESVLPEGAAVASLRGLYPLGEGPGYKWTDQPASIETDLNDFESAIHVVITTLEEIASRHAFDLSRLVLMGFSQGAALSFAFADSIEREPRAIVALAGYRPYSTSNRLTGVPIFWGHGALDDLVPIERARQDVEELESIGADVHYCEADVGHKLGIECTRGLKGWLEALDEDSA